MTPAKAKQERFDQIMVTSSKKYMQNADKDVFKEMSEEVRRKDDDGPLYM